MSSIVGFSTVADFPTISSIHAAVGILMFLFSLLLQMSLLLLMALLFTNVPAIFAQHAVAGTLFFSRALTLGGILAVDLFIAGIPNGDFWFTAVVLTFLLLLKSL